LGKQVDLQIKSSDWGKWFKKSRASKAKNITTKGDQKKRKKYRKRKKEIPSNGYVTQHLPAFDHQGTTLRLEANFR